VTVGLTRWFSVAAPDRFPSCLVFADDYQAKRRVTRPESKTYGIVDNDVSNGPSVPRGPRVLVLMAAYDGETWIDEQIDSILNQRRADVQIVIRDDSSSDATAANVARIAANNHRITLSIADAPSGSAAQNFFALIRSNEAADFDYVALSDQDDIWDTDKLERSVAALRQSGGCAASSSVIAVWSDGRSRLLTQNTAPTQSDFLFEGAGQGCTFLLTAPFYARLRSFLIEHTSLTRAIHYHDWSIYALARAWRLHWTFIPDATLRYRQHANNDTGARRSLSGTALRIRRIRSGWYGAQLIAISQLCYAAAASDTLISNWNRKLQDTSGWRRRVAIACTCMAGGRRRLSDNVVLIAAALLGAI
jgi:rhamnosyltransferase